MIVEAPNGLLLVWISLPASLGVTIQQGFAWVKRFMKCQHRVDLRRARERGREQCERSPYGDHKRLNAVYSWPNWPSCFSMIRAARNGVMVGIG